MGLPRHVSESAAQIFFFSIILAITATFIAIVDYTPLALVVLALAVLLGVLSWRRMKKTGVWGDR